jgi:hypothetical protein
MASSMTTTQYAALTSTFEYYQQVYEMFPGNREAQYEVYRLDQVNQTIARLEDELDNQRQEARQRLDSLLEHDKNDDYALHTLVYETCLFDGDRLMPFQRHNHSTPLTSQHRLPGIARTQMEEMVRHRTTSKSLSPAPSFSPCESFQRQSTGQVRSDVTISPPPSPSPPPTRSTVFCSLHTPPPTRNTPQPLPGTKENPIVVYDDSDGYTSPNVG